MSKDESTTPPVANQRQSVRKELRMSVTVGGQRSQLQEYFSRNLSEGGIFLEMDEVLPIGDEIALSFAVPGIREPFNLRAKVVRHHRFSTMDDDFNSRDVKGVGLAFVNLSDNDRRTINDYIAGKGVSILT